MNKKQNEIIHQKNNGRINLTTLTVNSDCGCSTTSCCEESNKIDLTNFTFSPMSVAIYGQVIDVIAGDKNIVDIASRSKIRIPAPCYRANKKKGCCNACVVEIDGEQKFACSTPPENGMKIVIDRDDLKAIRKQRLLDYKEGITSGNPCECSTSNHCC